MFCSIYCRKFNLYSIKTKGIMSRYYSSKQRQRKRNAEDKESESQFKERPPSHLRGREIGLYYAARGRARREARIAMGLPVKPAKPLGTILISDVKKRQIQTILDDTANTIQNDESENIQFHVQFQEVISGTMHDKLAGPDILLYPDTIMDNDLFIDFDNRKRTQHYQRMLGVRQKLPSYQKRKEILELVKNNQVVVISGETGCGKTTQVTQFILDDFLENKKGSMCNIICTQPRRISAITVAERVADERAEQLGHSVGYRIRVEHRLPRLKGSIVYCTTGVVLKRMENDPSLFGISHVILDEIHERDVMSDLLITLLKRVLNKRKDLKLILMSATLDAEKFSKYYNNCPHINIPGFTHPVQEFYLEDVLQRTGFKIEPLERPRESREKDPFFKELLDTHIRELKANKSYSSTVLHQLSNPSIEKINLELILSLLVNICATESNQGAILIFLTGFVEISKLIQLMERSGKFPKNKYLILPLHSMMPTVTQRQVFDRPPMGIRKIIVSTNIAETSITIDDIVFVVDCGKIKMTNYDVETHTTTLNAEWASLANANQRRGRAGRVQPGICFHLFSKARAMVLPQYQIPEILRIRLENVILTIKILQLGDVVPFLIQLMDSPCMEIVTKSLEALKRLDALDQNENLTPLGYHLARLPIAPQMGKMLVLGAIFNCIDPVLAVAASLDFKDAFQLPIGKERLVEEKKLELSGGSKSDHLLLYEALRQYETKDSQAASQFSWEYFLNRQTLNQLGDIKKQLMEYLYDMDFVSSRNPGDDVCNTNSHNMSLVKAIICAGLYPNVSTLRARKRKVGNVGRVIETGQRIEMHPKSILFRECHLDSHLAVFYLLQRSSSCYLHDATMVHPLSLIFFGDNYKYNDDGVHPTISIGTDKLRFKCTGTINALIMELKSRLNLILERKVSNPGCVNWQENNKETAVLRAVMELITIEDLGEIDFDAYDDY